MITDPTLSSTDPKPSAPKAPKVIRITPRPALPIPQSGPVARAPRPDGLPGTRWIDRLGRPLTDLRISVTDHCNFRCRYCMPKEKYAQNHNFLAMTELLTFDEILRLTGGEPLLRKGIENLVAQLAALRTPAGKPIDLAMTTNGSLLIKKAQALKDAGLGRITVSLDGIDEDIFQSFNDVGYPAAKVLEAIDFARQVGFKVKVNTVVKKGVNEGEILKICEVFRGTGVTPRFIEYMDVGNANAGRWNRFHPQHPAKLPHAGVTWTAAANSASSAPSRGPSAVPAHACASQWKGAFTSVFLPRSAATCAPCFAAAVRTANSRLPSAESGPREKTATRNCVPWERRRVVRKSK